MTPFSIQVQEAIAELTHRTKREIEAETAWRWAARASAAVMLIKTADTDVRRWQWISAAVEYGHEAIEHAASAGFEVLSQIQAQLAVESPALFGDNS